MTYGASWRSPYEAILTLQDRVRTVALMALSKTEFELKLEGSPGDIAAVRPLDFLQRAAVGAGGWERLTTTYYDSAEGRLKSAGLSLRIREEAGARILTAKLSPKAGGVFIRLETERRLAESDQSFSTGVAEIDRIIGPETADLEPVARTVTDRWSILAAEGGAIVEVSAETGRAERLGSDPVTTPIAEIELELLKGDPASLFTLAGRFIDAFDGRVRLNAESKLDRALRGSKPRRLEKPGRLTIPEGATAADLFGLALKPIALRVIETSALVIATHDGDAARQLRVALRRFRALERLFRKTLGGDELLRLATKARDYARIVGAARDLDVFAESSVNLTAAPAALRAAADATRAEAWGAVSLLLSGKAFGVFSLDLLHIALTEPWRAALGEYALAPAGEHADHTLDRSWKKLLQAAEAADFISPETLHPLRIKLKKFRYAAQFFRDLYGAEKRRLFFPAMSELQGAFGAINDAVVAQAISERLCEDAGAEAARAAGFIAGYRGAEAAIKAEAIGEKWRAFASLAPFWRDNPSRDDL